MGIQTKEAAKDKLNIFWREVLLSHDMLAPQPSPTDEEIQRRAYEIYISQGAPDGHDLEKWLKAERDLRQANGNTTPALE